MTSCLDNWDGSGTDYYKCLPYCPSKGCAKSGEDPYISGNKRECCYGLKECNKDWDGTGRWYYKCLPYSFICPLNTSGFEEVEKR